MTKLRILRKCKRRSIILTSFFIPRSSVLFTSHLSSQHPSRLFMISSLSVRLHKVSEQAERTIEATNYVEFIPTIGSASNVSVSIPKQ